MKTGVSDSLDVVQVRVGPPHALCDVVDGERVRPAQLLRDHFAPVRPVHADSSDVRGETPVSPVDVSAIDLL